MATKVFISYKHEDRARADHIAAALAREGVDVWWDPQLRFGQRDLRTIDEQLEMSRFVIVLWTAKAVRSESVLDEADYAREEKKLLPALLEEVTLPPRFRRIQAAKLFHENPVENDDWRVLVAQLKGEDVAYSQTGGDARRQKRRFIALNRMGGPALTTGLTALSSVAAAAPSVQFLFKGELADRILGLVANAAPAFSGVAALLVLQQMAARFKGG